jgi:carbonic anhydrase
MKYREGLRSELNIGSVLSTHFPDQCTWAYFGNGLTTDTRRRLGEAEPVSSEGMNAYCYMGPDKWYKLDGNYKCKSTDSSYQSPIDITSAAVKDKSNILPTLVSSYSTCDGCTITNDGHTIKVGYSGSSSLEIGGVLNQLWSGANSSAGTTYSLAEIDFHWGEDDTKGSEHLVGTKAFPLEMHMLHTQDGNAESAHSKGGLTMLTVMFEITATPSEENAEIKKLADEVDAVKTTGSSNALGQALDVSALLPTTYDTDYMTYKGSLTRPDCYESVNWVIASKTLKITSATLAKFRAAEWIDSTHQVMSKNYRPTQPLNGRSVYEKFSVSSNYPALESAAETKSTETTSAVVTWPSIKSKYSLNTLLFHWDGVSSTTGSEHQLQGKTYPLELQLMHTQNYNTDPVHTGGGVTAIGVMFGVDDGSPNSEIQKLLDGSGALGSNELIEQVIDAGEYYNMSGKAEIRIEGLLPDTYKTDYITYSGSLTTPGCFESVNWIIPKKPMTVSTAQLAAIKKLHFAASDTSNYRPVQALGSRKVYMKAAGTGTDTVFGSAYAMEAEASNSSYTCSAPETSSESETSGETAAGLSGGAKAGIGIAMVGFFGGIAFVHFIRDQSPANKGKKDAHHHLEEDEHGSDV